MIDEIHFLEEKYNSKLEQKNKVNIKTYLEYIYKILFYTNSFNVLKVW